MLLVVRPAIVRLARSGREMKRGFEACIGETRGMEVSLMRTQKDLDDQLRLANRSDHMLGCR
jgi:hypothetical protein